MSGFSIREIVEAWIIANNPSEEQRLLSEKRLSVCDECPAKKEILKKAKWTYICIACGCPLSKKSFTNSYNPCPLGKFKDIDNEYFKLKDKKTVI
jgi:hypothetical protein